MALCYAPEEVSGAVLVTEMAVDLARRGHQVSMITAAPSYPYGVVFPGYHNRLLQVEWLDGVKVVRTWSYISPQRTFWRLIFHYGTYCLSAFLGGLLAGKPEILVNYSPPLPLGLTAWLLSRIWKIPWVIQIEDLYPDAAMAAGVLTHEKVISFFYAMERFLYRKAEHISSISHTFYKKILAKGIPAEKQTVIPIWADPENVYPMVKENPFRQKHNLGGKFVVMYAGNMGCTSCLDDVLAAAEILKDDPDVHFVLVGEGVKKNSLQEYSNQKNLNQVLFLPYQPREIFNELMAAADVGLVTLNFDSARSSLPSKTFNIMASGRPIIAITPNDSELAEIVRTGDCGIQIPPEKPEILAKVIQNLKDEKYQLERMGNNGRSLLETTYNRHCCVDAYEKMLLGFSKNPTRFNT